MSSIEVLACFLVLPFWQAIWFFCLKIIPAEFKEEKCEFSMNFWKNLMLDNQKIFGTIREADWQGVVSVDCALTSVASVQTCAVSHSSQIIHSWFACQELKFREKLMLGPKLWVAANLSFHMLTMVEKWINRKELCSVTTSIFKRWNLLVTTNHIFPLFQQLLPSWLEILWQWDWCF